MTYRSSTVPRPRLRALACATALACLGAALVAPAAHAQAQAEAKDMVQIAQLDLAGNGDGGEGLALQRRPDGRRVLYLAHEGQKTCLSVIDVTNPKAPALIAQLPSPGPQVTRCNSLGLSGNVLAIANQTLVVGQRPAGMWLLDVADLGKVRRARSLEDLKLAFFDTSGPHSRGVHWLWFVDGEFAHLATGAADFEPTAPNDDQFYMTVDLRDPRRPREVGRWWLPGTRRGDACLPHCLPKRQAIDDGYRAHSIQIYPQRPDRAYVAYIDGGALILDIGDLAAVRGHKAASFTPRLVSRLDYGPPYPSWCHTIQPLWGRGLAVLSDEAVQENCTDSPKLIWLADIREESHPHLIATAPLPDNVAQLCTRGGRYGAHNLYPSFPDAGSAQLKNTFVGSFFNGGVRIYRLIDAALAGAPPTISEIGYFIPAAPAGNRTGTIQINHMIVDERGLIYANDRLTGGLYILKYTGKLPLD
jgi:hypothetical protein